MGGATGGHAAGGRPGRSVAEYGFEGPLVGQRRRLDLEDPAAVGPRLLGELLYSACAGAFSLRYSASTRPLRAASSAFDKSWVR